MTACHLNCLLRAEVTTPGNCQSSGPHSKVLKDDDLQRKLHLYLISQRQTLCTDQPTGFIPAYKKKQQLSPQTRRLPCMGFMNRPAGYFLPDVLVRLFTTFGLVKIIKVLSPGWHEDRIALRPPRLRDWNLRQWWGERREKEDSRQYFWWIRMGSACWFNKHALRADGIFV